MDRKLQNLLSRNGTKNKHTHGHRHTGTRTNSKCILCTRHTNIHCFCRKFPKDKLDVNGICERLDLDLNRIASHRIYFIINSVQLNQCSTISGNMDNNTILSFWHTRITRLEPIREYLLLFLCVASSVNVVVYVRIHRQLEYPKCARRENSLQSITSFVCRPDIVMSDDSDGGAGGHSGGS